MIMLEIHTEKKAEYWQNERGSGILSHGRSRIGSQIKKIDLEQMRKMDNNGYPLVFWWNGKTTTEEGINLYLPAGEGWRVTDAGKKHLESLGYELREV